MTATIPKLAPGDVWWPTTRGATFCNVTSRTMRRWIERGVILGYRDDTPQGRFYVSRDACVARGRVERNVSLDDTSAA